jgi:uncharacterized 2Fe-2S/4Fe-4S cluster protein (DUF4445 family)
MSGQVIFQPSGKRATASPGESILEIAQGAGVGISAICGGAGTCGNCRVRVLSGSVTPLNDIEIGLLYPWEADGSVRIACQTQIVDTDHDIIVDIPRETQTVAQRSQVEGGEAGVTLEPSVQTYDLSCTAPSVADVRGDWERLAGDEGWLFDAPVMATLSPLLRTHHWRARMVAQGERVIAFLPPGTAPLGFAVDVGTTGLAGYLVNLESGETLSVVGATNPQIAFGEDVMSRLALAKRDPARARQLQSVLIDELNRLIALLCEGAGVSTDAIVEIVPVGNTAMHHLLFGLPVSQLGLAPYVPAVSSEFSTSARALGLQSAPGAQVYTPPCVAGFVGADHVAMLLASEAGSRAGVTLYLDIGTNTEISLTAHGEHWACSAPSGPAFEGAKISHGMRAADGAIERVTWLDGHLRCRTIHDGPPVGICGSGVIDCIAVLREQDVLNPAGGFRRGHPLVVREGERQWVVLADSETTRSGRPVVLSRHDIGQIQMAKAAIRAGSKLLVELAGLQESDIDTIILAGAFGSYIDPASAVAIGLLQPLPLKHIHQIGNAAGTGAKRLLLNEGERAAARRMVKHIQYVELPAHADFKDRFSQALRLLPDPWDT